MNLSNFESLSQFLENIEEVDFLLSQATPLSQNYSTYIKSSILLLTTKFEKFLEDTVDEYIQLINNRNFIIIPEGLRLTSSIFLIEKTKDILNVPHKKTELKKYILNINALWKEDIPINKLKISNKFNYGKHGSEDMINLFNRIDICDIFSEIVIYESQEESLINDNSSAVPVDFKKKFNELVSIRNNVVHSDSSPNLTAGAMYKYRYYLTYFAENLIRKLDENIEDFDGINNIFNQYNII